MKNFKFRINGNEYDVEVLEVEGQVAKIEVNGTTYNVELQNEAPQPKTKPATAAQAPAPAAPVIKTVKESTATAQVIKGGTTIQVKSPLPGVIIQVLVKQGDSVNVGQTLCTLETMKMENAIKAENPGIVSAVKITPGQSVLQDEVLIEING